MFFWKSSRGERERERARAEAILIFSAADEVIVVFVISPVLGVSCHEVETAQILGQRERSPDWLI